MNEVQLANELRDTLAEQVLLYASDQGGYAQRDHVEKLADGDQWATSDAVQMLESRGLARDDSMASDVKLTPAGQRVAQRIRVMRSGQWRFEDLQRAALTWLKRQDDDGTTVADLNGFLGAPEAADFEPPVKMQELQDAIELLGVAEYVEPIRVAEQLGAIKAMITPKGRVALQSGLLPISQQGGGSSQTTYDNSSTVSFGGPAQIGALQSGGQSNVQTAEQVIVGDARSQLADRLAEMIKLAEQLPDNPGVEVRETLAEMGSEVAKPEPKRGVIQRLAGKALGACFRVFGTGAKAAATEGGQQGMDQLMQWLADLTN
jgi:hypothetical protein